ncbi:hypothetical protein [Streptomyces sp. H62]
MRQTTRVVVDRGRFQDTVTLLGGRGPAGRRRRPGGGRLAARGLQPAGEWRVRLRPWSVLVRLPVPGPWEELLRQYAAAPYASAARVPEIARLAVPHLPATALPGVFDLPDDPLL